MSFGRAPKKKQPLDEAALYEYAIGALGRRMRTVAELKRMMHSRVEENESGEAKIDHVVARLKEQRYLNDTSYASDYARLRQENSSLGKRRVRQDLIQKGACERSQRRSTRLTRTSTKKELARQHLTRARAQASE